MEPSALRCHAKQCTKRGNIQYVVRPLDRCGCMASRGRIATESLTIHLVRCGKILCFVNAEHEHRYESEAPRFAEVPKTSKLGIRIPVEIRKGT